MNPKIKKLWVESLKKEEYNQGKGMLRSDNDELCCLGVLCEIHRRTMKSSKYYWSLDNEYITPNSSSSGILPSAVVKWAELSDSNPFIDKENSLALLNDKGKTFKEIAKIINKKL